MIYLNKLYEKVHGQEPDLTKKIIFTEAEICSISAPISAVLSVIVFLGIFFVTTISITLFFSFSKFNILNSLNIYKKIFFIAAFVFGFFFVLFGFSISVLVLDFLVNFVLFNMLAIIAATKMNKNNIGNIIKSIPEIRRYNLNSDGGEIYNDKVGYLHNLCYNDNLKNIQGKKQGKILKNKKIYDVVNTTVVEEKYIKNFLNTNDNIYQLKMEETTYYFSDIYFFNNHYYLVNCLIKKSGNNILFPVVLNFSHSQSCWRVVSHLKNGKNGKGKIKFGKGEKIESIMGSQSRCGGNVVNLPSLVSVKLNSLLEEQFLKNGEIKSNVEQCLQDRKVTERLRKFIRKDSEDFDIKIMDHFVNDNKEFKKDEYKPNFEECIKKRTRQDVNYGKVTELFFLSKDQEILYTFILVHSDGRAFLSNAEYLKSNEISGLFGVREKCINLNKMNAPLLQYDSELKRFRKNRYCYNTKNPYHVNNWNVVSEILIIKEFYKHFKIPMPPKFS